MKKIILLGLVLLGLCGCSEDGTGYRDKYNLPPGMSYQYLGQNTETKKPERAIWITFDELPYKYFKVQSSSGSNLFYISTEELMKLIWTKIEKPGFFEEIMSQVRKCEDDGRYYLKKDLNEIVDKKNDTIKFYLKK
jgi:hypothetical protein